MTDSTIAVSHPVGPAVPPDGGADRYARFDPPVSLLCPRCGLDHAEQGERAPLIRDGHAMHCVSGHTFDISRKGVLDLRRHVSASGHYTAEFFRRRVRALRLGLFDALIDSIRDVLADTSLVHADAGPVADIGCGDGTVTKAVGAGIGLDLAMDALRIAAAGGTTQAWIAADLAHLPFADGSIGVLLDVFSPAEYGEFSRVAPGGTLIKVMPGPRHMEELRGIYGMSANMAERAGREAGALMRDHVTILDDRRVTRTVAIGDEEQAALVAGMSPVSFGRSARHDALASLGSITTDCRVVVGRLP